MEDKSNWRFVGKCEQCGKEIGSRYKSTMPRFCSHACSNQWKWDNIRTDRKKFITKTCPNCEKEFQIDALDHRIKEGQEVFCCCKKCAGEYIRKQRGINSCPVCGKDIYDNRAKYCSMECYRKDHAAKPKEPKIKTDQPRKRKQFTKYNIPVDKNGSPIPYRGNEKAYMKAFYQQNKTQMWEENKYKEQNNPLYGRKVKVRKMITSYVRKYSSTDRYIDLLGCTIREFREYLRSKFKVGMSFNNYGEWQIDHIVPLVTANTIEEVDRLCHYTNLQPLWAEENMAKGSKYKPNEEI